MEQKYNARFLGANTPEGFISLFDELYDPAEDWRAYIIKGGPGTGKSRLMRRVADELEQAGYTAQRVLCFRPGFFRRRYFPADTRVYCRRHFASCD